MHFSQCERIPAAGINAKFRKRIEALLKISAVREHANIDPFRVTYNFGRSELTPWINLATVENCRYGVESARVVEAGFQIKHPSGSRAE